MSRENVIEVMARVMCADHGFDPDMPIPDPFTGERLHWAWEEWKPEATEILSALEASGVRLMPVEATEEMLAAAQTHMDNVGPDDPIPSDAEIYRVLLAASPYKEDNNGT